MLRIENGIDIHNRYMKNKGRGLGQTNNMPKNPADIITIFIFPNIFDLRYASFEL